MLILFCLQLCVLICLSRVINSVPPFNPLDSVLGITVGYPFGYSYYQAWPVALRKRSINLLSFNPDTDPGAALVNRVGQVIEQLSDFMVEGDRALFLVPSRGVAVRNS
eukprot:Gregarina_sp_Poly_1__1531@NODE_1387_length_4237_cov_146_288729_g928_i0_p3_GENE_NODE_1387_length_4237_cov_146_288729_g928_i0NODE_1387_length_4237_cov_146_288729_g928_i0_p3_ORF_typecomplete_len108_score6_94_NODE_1387_length_4237_cov_146_288729_g928_i021642487